MRSYSEHKLAQHRTAKTRWKTSHDRANPVSSVAIGWMKPSHRYGHPSVHPGRAEPCLQTPPVQRRVHSSPYRIVSSPGLSTGQQVPVPAAGRELLLLPCHSQLQENLPTHRQASLLAHSLCPPRFSRWATGSLPREKGGAGHMGKAMAPDHLIWCCLCATR